MIAIYPIPKDASFRTETLLGIAAVLETSIAELKQGPWFQHRHILIKEYERELKEICSSLGI